MYNVVVEDVSFAYPGTDRLILDQISMNVPEGSFVCLLGQSGCGKSTLLRLLAGLEHPNTGSIRVGDELVEGPSLDRSVVFQDYGLFPWMSSGENVVLALRQRYPKLSKEEYKTRAMDALQSVGLSKDVYDKYPKELSGGMKQRCAIARSFSIDPPIYLMDEPFGALDAVTRAKLQDLLRDLWSRRVQKKTIFFVTHDVEEALLLATRIYVLGQSPSRIIYTKEIESRDVLDRKAIYESSEIIELRNELVSYINQDVLRRVD